MSVSGHEPEMKYECVLMIYMFFSTTPQLHHSSVSTMLGAEEKEGDCQQTHSQIVQLFEAI